MAILAGDAHFDSWGKIVEEYPRTSKVSFHEDASVTRSEGTNQLNCQLLKVSHHGSKHGTSLEYLEKLSPSHFMVTCADKNWYQMSEPGWGTTWPHTLTAKAIRVLKQDATIKYSYKDKNVIYKLDGTRNPKVRCFSANPEDAGFSASLKAALNAN